MHGLHAQAIKLLGRAHLSIFLIILSRLVCWLDTTSVMKLLGNCDTISLYFQSFYKSNNQLIIGVETCIKII